ncbi:MAG TPA: hypothetical protein VKY85_08180 [Candidatus Angelobacter sp.]|nr:hypothetical protein [Candidatus Angelobacter sp.]
MRTSGSGPLRRAGLLCKVACYQLLLAILFLVLPASAQDKPGLDRARAACGPQDVEFHVKTNNQQHPVAQPEAGKAMVYVIEDQIPCLFCAVTTRVGLDGTWVGANRGRSYFFFSVEAGEHHLCSDLQRLPPADRVISLAHLTAEAGKAYYFRARISGGYESGWFFDLEAIDSDEAQLLISSYPYSTLKPPVTNPGGSDSQNP